MPVEGDRDTSLACEGNQDNFLQSFNASTHSLGLTASLNQSNFKRRNKSKKKLHKQNHKTNKILYPFNLHAKALVAVLEGIDWYDIGTRSSCSTSKVCLVLSSQHKQPQNLQRQFYHLPTRPPKINVWYSQSRQCLDCKS